LTTTRDRISLLHNLVFVLCEADLQRSIVSHNVTRQEAGGSQHDATRIVIAHRLSTVVKADRIFVLEAGRVVESGTYADLMAHLGLFAKLARRQLA